MPKVYNKRTDQIPEGAVYVGRPSKWGNPYFLGSRGRKEAIELFSEYIVREGLVEEVKKELKGKDLVCWCAPEACHADVLLEIANATV